VSVQEYMVAKYQHRKAEEQKQQRKKYRPARHKDYTNEYNCKMDQPMHGFRGEMLEIYKIVQNNVEKGAGRCRLSKLYTAQFY
jgi:hypothetical protein